MCDYLTCQYLTSDMSNKNPARLTIRMPADFMRDIKIAALEEGRNVNEIGIELFSGYLKKKSKKKEAAA
jgi:ferredoxin-NADP reductase